MSSLAALIGAVSGLLIAPVTTIYYDTGFLIGLKGFVAAIVGGLSSYPLALAGALAVFLLLVLQMNGGILHAPLAGNFYALFPHNTLALMFGAVLLWLWVMWFRLREK